ncbi:MAG TPA: alpha/beta hydrolase [Acidimicrobiia bacterium]|nr:alpha/beta hydrolase [Acidimicrobiia bacterium]
MDIAFDWRGHQVRWTRIGSGPPVVLCHGTPWSSYVWRRLAARLSPTHRVYLWDMLGYGQSEKPAGDVSLAEQGRLLAALLHHWELAAPDVIAHDVGGAVALRAHLLHQVRMRSLALADVVALRPWGSPFFRLVAESPQVFTALPPNFHRALLEEYIAGAVHIPLSVGVRDALLAPWLGSDGQAAFYRQIAQADERHTDEIEHLYASIRIPTLIVWGVEDRWIPLDRATKLHQVIKGSRLELIDGAGHLLQEDQPDLFNSLLADWVQDQ